MNLMNAAARYRALIELGATIGVVPQLELWGFSKTLSRLGELAFVAAEASHPQSCVLPDVYHIYKGGSDLEGLRLINARAIHTFHMNDYPADPPREQINDSDRIFPGLGVAPLKRLVRILHDGGFRGMLSLELFNREYWNRDPLDVARYGLAAMRDVVQAGLETP
jgi:sugar phosphate isomerase/epimerase